MAAIRQTLPGARWHFSHGPMDIVIGADGEGPAVQAAHEAAWQRFQPLLDELVAELALLRQPVRVHKPLDKAPHNPMQGEVARRMWAACAPCLPFAAGFITPMAAVAGSVAQALISCYQRLGVRRAWVNNGGDIALHLSDGESVRIGLFADLARFDAAGPQQAARGRLPLDGYLTLRAEDGVCGVATSGWRGRSFSLGIADSVTVLARSAAAADAAATVVANAVNVAAAGIERAPASSLRDDSDLGMTPVTVAVPSLPPHQVREALARGAECARELQVAGLIVAAALVCQGQAMWVPMLVPMRVSMQGPALAPSLRELLAA